MKYEMLFSGIGGQGIMMLGDILCNVAAAAGYQVTFVPFYGQEKRGGRTMCNIVVSDAMESPIISEAELMLVMDERSLTDYEDLMKPGGTLIINSSMIDKEPAGTEYECVKLPINDIAAEKIGNAKTANMVALGAAARRLPFLDIDKIEEEVRTAFAAKPKLIEKNCKALREGFNA